MTCFQATEAVSLNIGLHCQLSPAMGTNTQTVLPLGSLPSSENESQSRPALWDPMDYRVHGILQARILEWVAFPFSRGSSQPRGQTQVSRVVGGFLTS